MPGIASIVVVGLMFAMLFWHNQTPPPSETPLKQHRRWEVATA